MVFLLGVALRMQCCRSYIRKAVQEVGLEPSLNEQDVEMVTKD
jgi:hypothetical protein